MRALICRLWKWLTAKDERTEAEREQEWLDSQW